MADDNTSAGTPGTGAPATPAAAPSTEVAAPSHRDWNAMAATQRQTMDAVQSLTKTLEGLLPKLVAPSAPTTTSGKAPEPAPSNQPMPADAGVADRLARLERELALKSGIADHGLTGDQRVAFEELAALVPADQIRSIAEKIARLKPSAAAALAAGTAAVGTAPVAPASVPPTVKPGTSNSGPASPGAAPIIPDRLRDIPVDVLKTMSMQEIRAKYEAQKRAQGQGNPWAMARDQLQKK